MIEKIKPVLFFYSMIISVGVLGGFLLKFEFTLVHFLFLVPIVIASYVSIRGFLRFLDAKNKGDCPAK